MAWAPGENEMPDIRLRFLSRTAAEHAIIDLWLRVARHDLKIPKMHMELGWNDRVDITLKTDDALATFALCAWGRQHAQAVSLIPFRAFRRPVGVARSARHRHREKTCAVHLRPLCGECFSDQRRRTITRTRLSC